MLQIFVKQECKIYVSIIEYYFLFKVGIIDEIKIVYNVCRILDLEFFIRNFDYFHESSVGIKWTSLRKKYSNDLLSLHLLVDTMVCEYFLQIYHK